MDESSGKTARLGESATASLAQRGLSALGIAGRVLHAGRPFAGAKILLVTDELRIDNCKLAEVESDANGDFDFGLRAATRYLVVAQARRVVARGVEVDLRKPDVVQKPEAVQLELRAATLVISGTVRDGVGRVLPSALVRAMSCGTELVETRADAEGRYVLCVSSGPVRVEAAAPGYGTGVAHRKAAREMGADFVLSPEITMGGRVIDVSGKAVSGATVIVETNGHVLGAIADTDAEGHFSLGGLSAGAFRLVARDFGRVASKAVAAFTAGATYRVELVLQQASELVGRVTVGGEPMRGALVTVEGGLTGVPMGSAVSQRDGRFAIAGLPTKGTANIVVRGHTVASPTGMLELAGVRDVELVCERLPHVGGRVVRSGTCLAGAEVALFGNGTPLRTFSASDGSFSLEGVKPATYKVRAQSLVEGAATVQCLEVGAASVDPLLLDLGAASSISGVVVDTAGAPIAGVLVSFRSRRDSGSDVTAADGTFRCIGLAGHCDYTPRVSASPTGLGFRAATAEAFAPVSLPDGKSEFTGIRLVVLRADLSISGRAVRDGAPAAGLTIEARSERGAVRAETDSDGRFLISGLISGIYRLSLARYRGAEGSSFIATAGDQDVLLLLPPVGSIEGELRGFSSLTAVTARSAASYFTADIFDEQFIIGEAPVGDYRVDVVGANGQTARALVRVSANAVTPVTVEAGSTGRIEVQVTDWRTGTPLSGAQCYWETKDGVRGMPAASDPMGKLVLDAPSGTVSISCFTLADSAEQLGSADVTLAPGRTERVAIQMVVARYPPSHAESIPISFAGDPPRVQHVHGSAQLAGVLPGDRLISVHSEPTADMNDRLIYFLLRDHPPGQPTRITVEREGAHLSFAFLPDALPIGSVASYSIATELDGSDWS